MSGAWEYAYDPTVTPDSFDKYIESSQKEAMEKFRSAVAVMRKVALPHWFIQLLEDMIMPPLAQIGFDESIQWALFKMSAPAWESMGPTGKGDLWFHPAIINNIAEIRKSILFKEKRKSEFMIIMENTDPLDRGLIVNRNMDPANIFSVFEEISTPWIILPRAYTHLERKDIDYLTGYIKSLLKEKEPSFQRILIRIIIEFVGNYTIKFISEIHPRRRMIEALFYGYAVLFWKNLRSPPNGLEHLLIFRIFFYWTDRCLSILSYPSQDMVQTADSMKKAMENVFPTFNAFGLTNESSNPIDKFLVTLRHGDPGIEAAVKYFGPAAIVIRNMTNGRIPYVSLPTIFRQLLRTIKNNYKKETPKTQGFIRVFLSKLKTAYDLTRIRSHSTDASLPDELRFAGPRVQSMIEGLIIADNY
jgi:hypothetical protein